MLVCAGYYSHTKWLLDRTHSASTEDEAKSVQLVVRFKHLLLERSSKHYNGQVRKVAYLTFDDGPGKYS